MARINKEIREDEPLLSGSKGPVPFYGTSVAGKEDRQADGNDMRPAGLPEAVSMRINHESLDYESVHGTLHVLTFHLNR